MVMWLRGAKESRHPERGQGGGVGTIGTRGSARPTPPRPHDCRLSQAGVGASSNLSMFICDSGRGEVKALVQVWPGLGQDGSL